MNAAPWAPAGQVRFIVSRFWAKCVWCGLEIKKHDEAAWYPEDRTTAHVECHEEASA